MSEHNVCHISSAIVGTHPRDTESVAHEIDRIDGVEVRASAPGKIVVVLEGPSVGALGDMLIRISAMTGVLSANMVFEQKLDEREVHNGW